MWIRKLAAVLVLGLQACTSLENGEAIVAKCMTDYIAKAFRAEGYEVTCSKDSPLSLSLEIIQATANNVLLESGVFSPEGVEIIIVNDQFENAFTFGPGSIFVTEGLLKSIHSEAELAWILGHEIGHWKGHDAVDRISYKNRALANLIYQSPHAVCAVLQIVPPDLDTFASPIDTDPEYNEFLRIQEFTADKSGLGYAVNAGYRPSASFELLSRLDNVMLAREARTIEAIEDACGQPFDIEYYRSLNSHPTGANRIESLQTFAAEELELPESDWNLGDLFQISTESDFSETFEIFDSRVFHTHLTPRDPANFCEWTKPVTEKAVPTRPEVDPYAKIREILRELE